MSSPSNIVPKLGAPADSAVDEQVLRQSKAAPKVEIPDPSPANPRPVLNIKPVAKPAKMRHRHRMLVKSFFGLVLGPLALVVFYLFAIAQDQYASTTGFTVRKEEGGAATDLLGGLRQFTGGGSSDGDVLYEFVQSQGIVKAIDKRLDLRAIYSKNWPMDPIFALWPDAEIEDLLWYWQRMVRISYDKSTSLIELRVLAFDPDTAQAIAKEVVAESQNMINALNASGRNDMMRYAEVDLKAAIERLKKTREAMTRFRITTQIVDPSADIQGQMGVVNNLQQQLAEALIDYDLLIETSSQNDPRVLQMARRIEVVRSRIAQERSTFASAEVGGVGEDYPTLMAEFESLTVDREYAEQTYRASLAAVDLARANIARQSRYLAAYVEPTLPQKAEYPQRMVLSSLTALFLTLAWSIMALVYYSIRDRR